MLAICGYAASWLRRFPLVPDLVFFALTVVGLLAVLRLPNPGIGAPLALIVGLITWIVTLRAADRTAARRDPALRRRSTRGGATSWSAAPWSSAAWP